MDIIGSCCSVNGAVNVSDILEWLEELLVWGTAEIERLASILNGIETLIQLFSALAKGPLDKYPQILRYARIIANQY